jgi:hypothetical protein
MTLSHETETTLTCGIPQTFTGGGRNAAMSIHSAETLKSQGLQSFCHELMFILEFPRIQHTENNKQRLKRQSVNSNRCRQA